jgi:small subunit ribosomal protein S16
MLMIRFQRIGKNKQPSYRLIVSEKAKDPQAGHVEILGVYNPTTTPKVVNIKKDRVEYWMSVGAKPSVTVHNVLVGLGILSGAKKRSVFLSKTRRAALEKEKASKAPAAPAPEAPAAA